MTPRSWFAAAALLVLLAPSCAHYATLERRDPLVHTFTSASQTLRDGLQIEREMPLKALGVYLAAAREAQTALRADPEDPATRHDYNCAVARVAEALNATRGAWSDPLRVPAPGGGEFLLRHRHDPRPDFHPRQYEIVAVDRYDFRGKYVTERHGRVGIGAPLVLVPRREEGEEAHAFDHNYYAATAVADFGADGECVLSWHDPLSVEEIPFHGRRQTLSADFTAPLAMLLAKENPRELELRRLFLPEQYERTARIARMEPFQPDKTVVLCVHGLMDSPATWTPMVNRLLADPEIRRRYQFWFFSYPSGYPYPYSAEILRDQLDAHKARHQVQRPMVVIGHSMGGLISRLLVTDTDERLWQEMFGKPLAETRLSPATRAVVAESLIFRSRSDIGRVVFIASPHRGSDLAANWLGRMASRLVRSPLLLLEAGDEILRQVAQGPDSMPLQRIPNSVDTLSPNNRFVQAIDRRPIDPRIPYHTIVGDRGKGGNLGRERPYHSDGVVPYWSSHLPGPRSERVVPSNHSAHQHPEAIAEVARILKAHRP